MDVYVVQFSLINTRIGMYAGFVTEDQDTWSFVLQLVLFSNQ